MKIHHLILLGFLALLQPAFGQLWPKPGGGFYTANTSPATGDYIQLWDAGTNTTQQISIGTLDARWQPIESTLTDIADGTIAENLVNTDNPWADNEVADNITVTGSIGGGALTASGFDGNLATTDDTLQEVAQKLDDLSVGAGADFDALTEATEADIATTDVMAVSDGGTEKKITLANLRDFLQSISWVFSSMDVTTLTTVTQIFEGATADASETTLAVVDPTADRTITFPDATGTVVLTGQQTDSFIIAISDETTALTTGTAKVTFRAPYAFTITGVRASLTTVSSSGTPTIDINETGTTILSTKLTVDASEKTSTTAAAAAVISDSAIADDAEITVDIDVAGTSAAGGKVTITHTH